MFVCVCDSILHLFEFELKWMWLHLIMNTIFFGSLMLQKWLAFFRILFRCERASARRSREIANENATHWGRRRWRETQLTKLREIRMGRENEHRTTTNRRRRRRQHQQQRQNHNIYFNFSFSARKCFWPRSDSQIDNVSMPHMPSLASIEQTNEAICRRWAH